MLKKSIIIALVGMWGFVFLGARGTYAAGLGVSKEVFGKMPDGTAVEKYTLSNTHGMAVSILTYCSFIGTLSGTAPVNLSLKR